MSDSPESQTALEQDIQLLTDLSEIIQTVGVLNTEKPSSGHIPELVRIKQYRDLVINTYKRDSVAGFEEVSDKTKAAAFDRIAESWDGLARSLMMALDCDHKTPGGIFKHLKMSGEEIPQWLRDELEMANLDHTISKGTRCVLIAKAMMHQALASVHKDIQDADRVAEELRKNCEHDWQYNWTDYHGSHKDEDHYSCRKPGCGATEYRP